MATTTRTTWKSPLVNLDSNTIGTIDSCEVVQKFTTTEQEYAAVRESVAISDNCHYGKFRIRGADAQDAVNSVVMVDVARLAIGRAAWTFMLREDGSVLCDVYILCTGDHYTIFSEGTNPENVASQLQAAADDHDCSLEDVTQDVAIIGLDGPYAWELLKEQVGVRILGLRYLEFLDDQTLGDGTVSVIRSGKTGEFGYQLIMPAETAVAVWEHLLDAGKALDIAPAGAETLSVCRMENRFINMHREGAEARNPLEINCRVMVDVEKEAYVGSEALEQAMNEPLERRVIGIVVDGTAEQVPALGAEVTVDGEVVGTIVNAGFSLQLQKPIALASLQADTAYVGLEFNVPIGDATSTCKTVSAPFIFNKSLTVRPQEDSYKNR